MSSSSLLPDLLSSTSSFVGNVTRAAVNPCNLPLNQRTLAEGLFCAFNYAPNTGLPIAGIVIFALLFILHLLLNLRSRSLLMIWITATAAFEVGGYISKLLVVKSNPANGYLAMTILLVISPNLLALVNYTVLGKLIAISIEADETAIPVGLSKTSSPQSSKHVDVTSLSTRIKRIVVREDGRIQPMFISVFFLISDLASLTVQAISASYLTNKDPAKRLQGEHIMTGGLAVPLAFFTVFTVLGLYILTSKRYALSLSQQSPSMRKVWIGLLSTMVLMSLRNIYRFLEYALGNRNWVASSEPMFYVFDALMVILSLLVYAYSDFGRLLPLAREEQLAASKRRSSNIVELQSPVKVIDAAESPRDSPTSHAEKSADSIDQSIQDTIV